VPAYTGSTAVIPNPERGFFQYTETHYNSPGTSLSDTFTGTNGAAPDSGKWSSYATTGSIVDIQSNALRLRSGTAGSYNDRAQVASTAAVFADGRVQLDVTPQTSTESYFLVPMRATTNGSAIDGTCYKFEVGSWGGVALSKVIGFTATSLGSQSIPGYGVGVTVHVDINVTGSTLSVYAWTGTTKPGSPTISVTDTGITAAGYTGCVLTGGSVGALNDWRVDNYQLTTGGGSTGYTPLDSAALAASRASDNRTVVFRYFVLEAFLGTDTIDSAYLSLLAADFNAIRTAGCKAVIRFAYSTSGDMTPPYGADPPVARVLTHISQLASTLNAASDVIYALQMGFIGMWGENYYTDNFGDVGTLTTQNWADREAVLDTLLSSLNSSIFVLVRYPGLKLHRYGSTSTAPAAARVGFHNDAFLADFEDFGTYTTFTSLSAAATRSYVAAQTSSVPMGGESAATNGTHSQWPSAAVDLAAYHWDFLNPIYHPDVLTSWGSNTTEAAKYLGYRLRLVSSNIPTSTSSTTIPVSFDIANDGYGYVLTARTVQVVFTSGSTTVTRTLVANPRTWAPGTTTTVSETVTSPGVGTWSISIKIPDPVLTSPAYAIQFANTGTWDATNGRNNLTGTISVSAPSGSGFVTAFNETFADLSRWVVLSAANGSSNGYPGGPAQFGTDEIETVGSDPENLSYSAGNLRITPTLRSDGWHSARIETQRTFKPAQGSVMRVEASIQLPNVHGAQAAGYWPAFWMMGSWQRDDRWIWPACFEFDVMESVNGVNANTATVHGGPRSSWYGPFNEPNGYSNAGVAPTTGDIWGGFHTYTFEWDRTTATDTLRWYVDGVQVWTAQPGVIDSTDWNPVATTQPGVFIILNVAMGGQFPAKMGGGPNTGTLPGVPMIVQYVRVSYNGSEAPEAAQGNNGVGGVGTVPPPPVIPPVPPPAPTTTSTRTPISTAAPAYTTGASYYTPDSTKTTLTAPLPTNQWFMNFMLGTGHEAVNMFPYDVKVTAQGLDVCVPQLNTSSPTSVLATMLQNFSFRATTVATTQKLTSFTDLSATVQWSNGLSATIVRGMAYVTMNYTAATPVVTTQNAIIAVNGTAVGATGTFTGTKFKFALNNGQTWLLYASTSVTLTLATANTLTASAAFTGTLRLALLPNAADEGVLDSSAPCIPTGGAVDFTVSGNVATETYTFSTTGSGTLLMYTMLHHQTWWTFPSAYASPVIATLRGQMKSALGPTWTLSIPLPTVSWDNANPIRSDRTAAIATAMAADRSFVPVVADPYFGGKQLAKSARLALIAAQLGDTASRDLLLGNLKTVINNYLQGTALRYDTVWGGIVSAAGLTSQDTDFGNGRYNDHHFHYGYTIYAAAVIARYDSAWLTANQTRVNDLVRDIMNPSTADPYFTQFRHFDLFEAHSWAAGNFEFGDNRNQESTSEAVNAWYGVYLWGLITAQTQIRDTARLLFAQEVYAAQKYWQIKQSDSIYPAPFKQNGVVGIVWSNKVDYATFFGAQAEYIHGIQMLPITPASEVLLPKDWVAEDWANVLSGLWTRSSVWRAEMVSGGSGYTPAQVSPTGQGYTNGMTATGGSGSGLVFNVNITAGQIVAPFIVFNQHGTGYTEGDIITLNGSGGTGATVRVHTQPEDGWKAVLLGGWSQVNPDDAWTKTLALTSFDDGSSKTQALVHIATQSATAANSLTGIAASTSTTTGNLSLLSGGKTLQGSAASTSTTTGAITLTRSLQGSAQSVSTTTGNLFLSKPNTLQGYAVSTSLTTGSGLRIASFNLIGIARSISTVTALLVLEPNLPDTSPPSPDAPPPPLQPGVEPHQFLVGLIQSGLGHYKLSPEQIAEIYYRHLQGERFADMAVEFGLPQSVMRKIISRLRLTDYST
jgi:endo-1,3(4)-beta-glucanase